jgi:hypothetical protein
MPGEKLSSTGNKPYLRIVQGNWVEKADKDHPEAKRRDYTVPKTGEEKHVYEITYRNWEGAIQDIEVRQLDFGRMCYITLEDAILTINTDSRYFQNLVPRLMNADLSKPILFHPYNMETGEGKKVIGISIKQNGEKIPSYYADEKNRKKDKHPEPSEKDKSKKGYWTMYFSEVEEFLISQLNKLEVKSTPKAEDPVVDDVDVNEVDFPWDEDKPEPTL